MKATHYYFGLGVFVLLVIAFWLGIVQGVGEWLWNLLHGASPVK